MAFRRGNNAHKNQVWDFDYIGCPLDVLFAKLATSQKGLSDSQARERIEQYGYNELARKKNGQIVLKLLSKFLNPLVIVLLIIAGFSLFLEKR